MPKPVHTDITELKIPVSKLEMGMHVVRLDRPWLETDFLIQGFVVHDEETIHALASQCDYVFVEARFETRDIDEHNKQDLTTKKQGFFSRLTRRKPQKIQTPTKQPTKHGIQRPPLKHKKITYSNRIRTERELPVAKTAYASAKTTVKSIMNGVRLGRMIDMNQARSTVDEVVDSILRNPDALTCLVKLKNKDEYTAEHSLNVCILTATFARHLGHEEADVRQAALCGLLHDVGKARVPDEILNKEGRYTAEELDVMKEHPTHGRDLLMEMDTSDLIAVDVAYSHHERLDGNGYPRGLFGPHISYFSKMVAITDCYDAITSTRVYDGARASMEALDIIYKCRGRQFDAQLAIEFIKCIGIYPPGSIVEFTNGEVGIIVSSQEKNKLRPRVWLVRDANKSEGYNRMVDLHAKDVDPKGQPYVIAHELPNGAFGVDLKEYVKRGLVLSTPHKDLDIDFDDFPQI